MRRSLLKWTFGVTALILAASYLRIAYFVFLFNGLFWGAQEFIEGFFSHGNETYISWRAKVRLLGTLYLTALWLIGMATVYRPERVLAFLRRRLPWFQYGDNLLPVPRLQLTPVLVTWALLPLAIDFIVLPGVTSIMVKTGFYVVTSYPWIFRIHYLVAIAGVLGWKKIVQRRDFAWRTAQIVAALTAAFLGVLSLMLACEAMMEDGDSVWWSYTLESAATLALLTVSAAIAGWAAVQIRRIRRQQSDSESPPVMRVTQRAAIFLMLALIPIGTDLLIYYFSDYPTTWTVLGINGVAAIGGVTILLGVLEGKRWAGRIIGLLSIINATHAGAGVLWTGNTLLYGDFRGVWGAVGLFGLLLFLIKLVPYAALSFWASFALMRRPTSADGPPNKPG